MMPAEPKKKRADTRKQIWIVKYDQACPSITHTMLEQQKILPIECHTAVVSDAKYTLIHCSRARRLTRATANKAVERLAKRYDIVLHGQLSEHGLLSNTDMSKNEGLAAHPGFMRIYSLFRQRSAELESWVKDDEAAAGSLLVKYLRIDNSPAVKLVDRDQTVAKLTSQLEHKDQRIAELSSQLDDAALQLEAKDKTISDLSLRPQQVAPVGENAHEIKYNALREEIIERVRCHRDFHAFRSRMIAEKQRDDQ